MWRCASSRACSRSLPARNSSDRPTTSLAPDGGEIAIKDGKIDGNKISFILAIDFGGMPVVIGYNGVVAPAEIKFTGDFMGMPFEFTVTKAK